MGTPTLIEVEDAEQFGAVVADYFSESIQQVSNKPTVVLPTGFTPLPFYKEVVERYQNGESYLNKFKYLALDEYLGLPEGDHRLFASWLSREILSPLSILNEDRIIFDSATSDTEGECARIEKAIEEKGRIDLAIIGLGSNGHIGFNEPGSHQDSKTRKIKLTLETREANSEYWGSLEDVPTHAMTLGIGTLKKAKKTLLMVLGKHKARILKDTLSKPVCVDIPSTYLQNQEHVTIIGDRDAFSEME